MADVTRRQVLLKLNLIKDIRFKVLKKNKLERNMYFNLFQYSVHSYLKDKFQTIDKL